MRADGVKTTGSAAARLGKRERTRSPINSRLGLRDVIHGGDSPPKSAGVVIKETMERLDTVEKNLSLAYSIASSRGKLRSDR